MDAAGTGHAGGVPEHTRRRTCCRTWSQRAEHEPNAGYFRVFAVGTRNIVVNENRVAPRLLGVNLSLYRCVVRAVQMSPAPRIVAQGRNERKPRS